MNLYFRLLIILFKARFARRIDAMDESRLQFRVWPLDCDINFHLTNARYFSLCDLSRIYLMGQAGILFNLVKRKWLPVVQAQEVSYFKPINPFQCFEVLTTISYWDDRYWYIEHNFVAGNQLCAVVQVRGVFVQGNKTVSMQDVLSLSDEHLEVPAKPVNVEHWQKLLEAKKELHKIN